MINSGFTIIGLWIVVMFITFLVTVMLALLLKIGDDLIDFINSFNIALIVVIVLLEVILCSIYVKFKNNPEIYGYTKIEQQITEGEE